MFKNGTNGDPDLFSEEIDENEIFRIRREKFYELQKSGRDPFIEVKYPVNSSTSLIIDDFENMEGSEVSIAGRIMSKRDMGKASFFDIQDKEGRIQLYLRINDVGEDSYEHIKKYDLGDIIGVEGDVFRTRRGEISIKVKSMTLLAKSFKPLPEKWHGLKDVDLRYRQRYLDLIVNPDVKKTFIKRTMIIRQMRNYLDGLGFLEVETPLLNPIPGGAAARPFVTHHNTLDMELYLRIAPELYLKRLIIGGLEKVYEIGRMFRNEGMSVKHNPEFTMMELYMAYTDYRGMMDIAEGLISTVALKVNGTMTVNYQGTHVDLSPGWERLTMIDAVKKYADLDFDTFKTGQEAVEAIKERGYPIKNDTTWGEALNFVFEEHVEDKLTGPVFIYDYPVEISPLTKRKPDRPELTERFEIFITGREFGNAYSELNDPIDQRERFEDQMKKREAGDEEANMMDEDFINALEYGMPPAGGLGIGVDRLVMLLTDSASIRDVLMFPTMKPRS